MTQRTRGLAGIGVWCAVFSLAAMPAMAGPTLRLDIAEDGTRFSFDEEPVFDDGLPAYGNGFVTQGYIYPAGTLTCTEGSCNGVLADGSPEFQDLVLGEWSCWGTHVGDGAHTTSGPWVVTTQQFSFGAAPGSSSVVTSGYELADLGVPVLRAIVGGTGGSYRKARGQQEQTFVGFNPSAGVVLQVELRVRR
jgi:hypothetical protein